MFLYFAEITKTFLCLYIKMGEITIEKLDSLFDKKLAPIRRTPQDLTNSVSFLGERLGSTRLIRKLKVSRLRQMQFVTKTTTSVRLETSRLSNIIEELKDNINDTEQYSRREYCEISGTPVTSDEDTANNLVIKLGALMNVE